MPSRHDWDGGLPQACLCRQHAQLRGAVPATAVCAALQAAAAAGLGGVPCEEPGPYHRCDKGQGCFGHLPVSLRLAPSKLLQVGSYGMRWSPTHECGALCGGVCGGVWGVGWCLALEGSGLRGIINCQYHTSTSCTTTTNLGTLKSAWQTKGHWAVPCTEKDDAIWGGAVLSTFPRWGGDQPRRPGHSNEAGKHGWRSAMHQAMRWGRGQHRYWGSSGERRKSDPLHCPLSAPQCPPLSPHTPHPPPHLCMNECNVFCL